MEKPTKRKAFNFLRSYFDVLNEIEKDEDKLNFLLSIINKQFLDEDPKELNFLVKLCYASQKHSIESSIKGWKRVNKDTPLTDPSTNPPTNPPTNGKTNPQEEEEEEEEEVEEEEEEQPKGGLKINLDDGFLIQVSEFFSQSNQVLKERVCKTLNVFFELEKFEIFKSETLAYIEFKNLSGERIHAWESYLRDWEKTSWKQKLKNEKSKEKISPQKKSRIDEFIGS